MGPKEWEKKKVSGRGNAKPNDGRWTGSQSAYQLNRLIAALCKVFRQGGRRFEIKRKREELVPPFLDGVENKRNGKQLNLQKISTRFAEEGDSQKKTEKRAVKGTGSRKPAQRGGRERSGDITGSGPRDRQEGKKREKKTKNLSVARAGNLISKKRYRHRHPPESHRAAMETWSRTQIRDRGILVHQGAQKRNIAAGRCAPIPQTLL